MAALREVKMRRFTKDSTITVKMVMTKEFKTRMYLASLLFKAGACILGAKSDVEAKTAE